MERHEDPEAVYADHEAAASVEGAPLVRLKPAWSPTLLSATSYAGPVVLFSRDAVRRGLAAAPAPPADTDDVLLRLAGDPDARVAHVARSLFVARAPMGAIGASRPAAAEVAAVDSSRERVPVIIPTAYREGRLTTLLGRLAPVAGAVSLRIVDDGTRHSERAAALALCEAGGLQAEAFTSPRAPRFNFSQAVNTGARGVTGPLLLLNDDVEPPHDDAWLHALLARLDEPGVGVVGAVLRYPQGALQHIGVLVERVVGPRHVGAGCPADWRAPDERLGVASERSAVTAACMAVDGGLFERIGGLDEDLAVEYGDVDFCLRAGEVGARSVLEPGAVLVHHEKASRGNAAHPADREFFAARWGAALSDGDPFYHPGLDPRLDWEPLREQDPPRVRSRLALIGPPAATERPRPSAEGDGPPAGRVSSRSRGR
jgi:hypothetical protein